MDATQRVDQELMEPLQGFLSFFGGGLNLHDIPSVREQSAQMTAAVKGMLPEVEGVSSEDHTVPGPEGAPEVMVRVYRPESRMQKLPALLWIHGGGMVIGSVEGDDFAARNMTKDLECVVVSVEYRLAPEHPFPAPVEDCYAALKWLSANAEELGVDGARLAVGGASAGGGLAAGLALLARDRGEVPLIFQYLIYPMLDDRNVEQASDTVLDTFLWSREHNLIGWRSYVGADAAEVSPYAAPARATDLSGLPPAYIPVGELDLFLQEDMAYADRLIAANVPVELHVFPGAYHGFDVLAPASALAQRALAERNAVLRRALQTE